MTDFNDYIMGLTFLFFFYGGRLVAEFQLVQAKAKKKFTGAITRFGITSWELLRNHGM